MPQITGRQKCARRVAHLTCVHPRYDTRIFVKECASLVYAGMDVCLIVADGLGDEIRNGVKIFDVSKPKMGRLYRMTITVARVFKKALSLDCDVYHLHDPELISVGLLLRLQGRKVIFDVHEDLPRQIMAKEWIKPYLRRGISKIAETFENLAMRWFSLIVTATPHINSRFSVLHGNCVNVNNYPLLSEFRNPADWNEKKQEICYIGAIARIRGNYELVEAMSMIKGRLNLAGNFSPASLSTELKELEGWPAVKYWGFQDRAGIHQILARSKVGVVTLHPIANYLDSLPVKMFEYMAAGIPIVASNFPFWREIITRYECGLLVDPRNSVDIARAINYLLMHPDEAVRMGRNGRKAVEHKFNWSAEEKKLIAAYDAIDH